MILHSLIRTNSPRSCCFGSKRLRTWERRRQQTGTGKHGGHSLLAIALGVCAAIINGSSAEPCLASHRCRICLPATLSKDRRKAWHGAAARAGLQSLSQVLGTSCILTMMILTMMASVCFFMWLDSRRAVHELWLICVFVNQGVGAERHLQIAPRGSLGPKARMCQHTKRLWDLAQEAGGAAAQLSLAEIQTMLDTKTLSPLLRQLEEQRCMQEHMCPVILSAMLVHWHLSPNF